MEHHRHRTSNSMLVPYADRRLAVAPPTASRFRIPVGWGVEEVPRRDGSRSDTYYYEPESGKKFRSIKEVHRHLNGEECHYRTTRKRSVPIQKMASLDPAKREFRGLKFESSGHRVRRMIVSDGKLWKLNSEQRDNHLEMVASRKHVRLAPYILPDGWIVEEIPRRFENFTDKYYYEPETGQKFRSLVAIERYLAELDENAPLSKTLEEIMENKPLAKVFKLEHHTKGSSPRKKKISRENTQASSFMGPPMKVNWVLASPQGDVWNPYIAETLVPDSVKQQWTNRLMLFMKEGNSNCQSSQA